ncbi:MAG: TolC family protein [Ignavibacteria bacterium]|nr:TolC family protein [Ignavibacteria bacterium]MBI3766553.1 TolC family protein [Ignavibacteriales bacterium]
MVRNLILQLIFIVLIAATNVVVGQTRANPDSALQMILDQLKGTRLPLSDALQNALKNATSVRTAEASYLAARGAARREAGSFDPEVFFTLNYLDQKQPTASFFAGAPVLMTTQTSSASGLRLNLPIGTKIEASLNTVRLNTNSSFAFLNPQYTSFGNLSLRQPLLGGFHISARKQLTKAEQESNAAKARYDQEILVASTQVEQNYWDLYAAERDYAVQKLTRDRADAFLKDTELRAKTGLIGPNQVANARTFLAEQEILLLDREEQLDRLSDQFASLIGVRPDTEAPRFITVDHPPEEFPVEEVNVLVKQAIQNNLELQAAKADVEAKRALSSAALWGALPSINLVGSLGGSGLTGTAQDVIFGSDTLRTTVGGGFGDAVRQVVKREFPSWSVGIEISIPIGLRSGLGEQDRLEAEVTIAEQRYVQQSRILEEQVRAGYRELFHGKRRLVAAREGVEAAQEQVRIGLIEFQNGRSTAFELVRLGADFAVAQQRYSQALVRSAKAAAGLKQLTSGAYAGPTSR